MEPTPRTYAELKLAFDVLNTRLFEGMLPACLITLQREKRTYGYFSSKRFGSREGAVVDEIAINPEYFAVVPLVETLQTMAHEMVHLWQAHFGAPGRGRYHNSQWAAKMEAIGLMPSSTGLPGGRKVGDQVADYAIPGGAFVAVVQELIDEHGFGITWFDRRPPPSALYPEPSTELAAELPTQAMSVPAQSGLSVEPKAPSSTNRSNRLKYTCPGCSMNVWGKPALRVACLDCQAELEATSP